MTKIKVIHPVTTSMSHERVMLLMEQYKEPTTEICDMNLRKGPESLEFAYDKAYAELPTVHAAEEAETDGYDGVIIYCFADPGLAAARERLSIPVVGLCETSIHLASLLGSKFTVLLAGSPELFKSKRLLVTNRIRKYGFEHKCASVRSLGIPVLELEKNPEKQTSQLVKEAKQAIENDGADTIVLGCGGILRIQESILNTLGIPLIIPALAALKVCELLIQIGLAQSKLRYPFPEEKKRLS